MTRGDAIQSLSLPGKTHANLFMPQKSFMVSTGEPRIKQGWAQGSEGLANWERGGC